MKPAQDGPPGGPPETSREGHLAEDDGDTRGRLVSGPLGERLGCLACRTGAARLSERHGALGCPSCGASYPLYRVGDACLPWLMPAPEVAHLEWSARLRGFLQKNTAEYNRLNRALGRARDNLALRSRLSKSKQARLEHRDQVLSILGPVRLDGDDLVAPATRLLNQAVPREQALTSYASNVFRDWAWDNGESEMLASTVADLLTATGRESIGATLTLGCGACRLPYDIHRCFAPPLSVALDLNPLLLLLGSRVIRGDTVPLYEFPIAALDGAGSGVLQHCRAPAAVTDGELALVLGDATRPPFLPESFDTIVTPWLIDILPRDLNEFLPTLNGLLQTGGVWVNTGSLVFTHDDPCRRYGEPEVLELVREHGFELITIDHRRVPYLQSPHSAHGRVERITSFAAIKRDDARLAETSSVLPAWILDPTQPVPAGPEIAVASATHLLNAQVLAAIDGKRSIQAVARLVAREYDLDLDECIFVVQRVLRDAVSALDAAAASPD